MNLAAFALAAGTPLATLVLTPPERDKTKLDIGHLILAMTAGAVCLVGGAVLSFTKGKYASFGPSIALGGVAGIAIIHVDDRMGSTFIHELESMRKKLYSR